MIYVQGKIRFEPPFACTVTDTWCKRDDDDDGPDFTRSQHEEQLADRWLKHESPFVSVKAGGSRLFSIHSTRVGSEQMCVNVHIVCVRCIVCLVLVTQRLQMHAYRDLCVNSACVSFFSCLLGTESAECPWNENKCGFAMATDECQSRREQQN